MSPTPGSGTAVAADATESFFQALTQRGPDPLLRGATGTMRFELINQEGGGIDRWLLTIDDGVTAARRDQGDAAADCTVRAPRELFGAIAAGQTNAMAALLRGELVAEGDLELLMLIQRFFPGQSAGHPATRRHDG